MAILDPNEIFFTAFEPKQANRFIMYVDGFPSYIIKAISAVTFEQGEVVLNHINVYTKVKGKTKWSDLTMTLFDPITPSGAQATMEWLRLHHESVTGRDGYSDMYKNWYGLLCIEFLIKSKNKLKKARIFCELLFFLYIYIGQQSYNK